MKQLRIKTNDVKRRLDLFIAENMPQLSRSFINKLLNQSKIKVNGTLKNPSYKLRLEDIIEVDYDLKQLEQIPKINMPIIFEDSDVIVVDKPAGVLTHSKGVFNPEATVATFIKSKIKDMKGERAGIVHRLDRGTSGVMIAAKNQAALTWLQKQFSTRKVKKSYVAIISGIIEPPQAIIDMPIERNPKKPQKFRTSSLGKPAITTYRLIKSNGKYSLVELNPKTGRTHQLRVHLKQLGYPIIGDLFYDGENANRLYLHSQTLELTLPSKERRVFKSIIPAEFKSKLKSND